MYVRGLPLTVPQHAAYVNGSPYTLRLDSAKPSLYRGDDLVGVVGLPRRPKIYDMETADGVPYWKIALLHLDSIASTVVQKCIYWDTPEQCGFCGIELTRGRADDPGQDAGAARRGRQRRARARRGGRRDADDGLDQPSRPRGPVHRAVRGGDQGRLRYPRAGSVRAARRAVGARRRAPRPASTRSASTSRHSIPTCSRASPRARRSAASRATSARGSGPSRCSAAGA